MLPALEQLVPDDIARLEHACSPAGNWTPLARLAETSTLRRCRGAIVGASAPSTAQDRGATRLREDGALDHHRDSASSPFNGK